MGSGSPGRDREQASLRRDDLSADPVAQFERWYREAEDLLEMPERMTLATVDSAGHPDARMVLLKGFGRDGFRFFTNLRSPKARHLETTPRVALVLHWPELDRQIRIRGTAEMLPEADSNAYFETRDRLSRLSARASPQSRVISGRESLESLLAEAARHFGGIEGTDPVPRPGHWGGYLVRPAEMEFWQGRPGRLHDRFRYTYSIGEDPGGSSWRIDRLAP